MDSTSCQLLAILPLAAIRCGCGSDQESERLGRHVLLAGHNRSIFKAAPKSSNGFQEIGVFDVPQAATMKVRAQFPQRCHELAGTHLGNDLRQRVQSVKQFGTRIRFVHDLSFTCW